MQADFLSRNRPFKKKRAFRSFWNETPAAFCHDVNFARESNISPMPERALESFFFIIGFGFAVPFTSIPKTAPAITPAVTPAVKPKKVFLTDIFAKPLFFVRSSAFQLLS